MQFFMFCFFVVAVTCLVVGLRKSHFGPANAARQHCATCGWTKKKVQLCWVQQHQTTRVTSLCLDCSAKQKALPVRSGAVLGTAHPACG